MNATVKAVFADAFDQFSAASLEQIAAHCESSLALAKGFCETPGDGIDMIQSEQWDTLRQLANYCRAAIAIQQGK